MRSCLFILIAWACAGEALAADFTADFSSANQSYARGKYSEAATAYEKILQAGVVSPNLLFNYGSAEFKAGNPGKSIAAFRDAELLAPRDADIRANLGFVRSQVQGATLHESRWQDWFGQLTLNEWTLLATAALWLTFLILAAKQYRPALAPKLGSAGGLFICLTILFGAVAGLQAVEHFSRQSAVVVSDAVTRSGPFDDAQNAFAVHDGAELSVVDQHGDWVQVADGSGRTGWLSTRQVELIPGA
ncbi:MAG TPA: SH3 domain-containing protein [Verrucomicrobiae bacterium]|jgi:tetratricopeptide (TPR) repeat protein